ncbi:MAG TPA: hypothetical protein VMX54_05975 [Vicinamibacteria bacterium]|nr:hypothetical protein [Vicinamibacteria bacterium]
MQMKTAARRSADAQSAKDRGLSGPGRRRWVRVKVVTDAETYVGSLRLASPAGGLRELVEADRSYLALWSATHGSSGAFEEFVAIHKSAIRVVVQLGASGQLGSCGEEE